MSNKEIFKAIDIARKQRIGHYHPPFRVGRKQKRVVLDNRGYEVVKFNYGDEEMAQDYCNYLNNK